MAGRLGRLVRRAGTAWQLRGVRGRIALLVLVAAVPLVLLAVVIIWQDARVVAGAATERVAVLRAGAAARVEVVLDAARAFLGGLAAEPGLAQADPGACTTALADALALQPGRFIGLEVTDATGRPRCTAGTWSGAADTRAAWFAVLRGGGRHASVALQDTTPPSLLFAVPRHQGGDFAGAVIGRLAVGGLVALPQSSFAWLLDETERALPLGAAPPGLLPAPEAARRLLASEQSLAVARAADGRPLAFAAAPVAPGLRLLVATEARPDVAIARHALLRRVAGLVLLLGAGLAAVAIGARMMLVHPIKRLSAAVQAWREGGAFDPGPGGQMPLELRQLANSFAEAGHALAERERQLQRAVEQQELLMQEIHHRVKNNLQIIASLLNLQASRIRLPEARREFAAARDRIRALATLHRHLYAHGDLHTINMRSFLNELCGQLLAALGETAGSRIHLTIEAPELQISSDQAVPIALIVTEAVSNAAKYAFPDGRSGHISVALGAEEERARLVIQDDGVGVPEGPGETETGMRDGLGLHLIRGFARQLGARLDITQDHGTRYEVLVDLRRERRADSPEAPGALG
jgi:two-component sensor histidine kinase